MKVGDLVRWFEHRGDGYGGAYKKVVGKQIGTILEIDCNPDYPWLCTVLWPDNKITEGDRDGLEVVKNEV